MNWIFVDVDGTLIDHNDNPRPYIIELFQRLNTMGCNIIVWSAGGAQYAQRKIGMISNRLSHTLKEVVNLDELIYAYADKSAPPVIEDSLKFYIDDMVGLIECVQKTGHGAFWVPFYAESLDPHKKDNWLLRAAEAAEKFVNGQNSTKTFSDNGRQS